MNLLDVNVLREPGAAGSVTVRFTAEGGDAITVDIVASDVARFADDAIVERARAMMVQAAVFGSDRADEAEDETYEEPVMPAGREL